MSRVTPELWPAIRPGRHLAAGGSPAPRSNPRIRLYRARNGSERSHTSVRRRGVRQPGPVSCKESCRSGGETQVMLVPVAPADLAEDAEHLLGGRRADIALPRHRPDPPDRLLTTHGPQLNPGMPTGELRQERDSETGRDEPLD